MAMYSALYYPHAGITDENIIKTGLLLWDQVEYISPYHGYRPDEQGRDLEAALEMITKPLIPSDEQKRLVHEEVKKLVNSDLPEWFVFIPHNTSLMYRIYPQKMLWETWQLLVESRFVTTSTRQERNNTWESPEDYIMSSSLGLTLMSILADCCAGSQKRMITDEIDSYSALARYITQINDGEYVGLKNLKVAKSQILEPNFDQLITLSLKVVNTDDLDIKRLVELRRREHSQNDTLLSDLRRNYFTKLDTYVKRISEEAKHAGDEKEILRVFELEMEHDLVDLKRELRLQASKSLLTKEFLGAIVAQALSVVEPVYSSLVSVGLLGKTWIDYRDNRRKVLKNHAMSWLYH